MEHQTGLIVPQDEAAQIVANIREATGRQEIATDKMTGIVDQMAKLLLVMQNNLQQMEKTLKERVSVSGAQAQTLAAAIRNRARELCEKSGLPYDKAGRAIRETIRREMLSEYTISSVHDLPQIYYDVALSYIRDWSSYALIRRLRSRFDE